MTKWGLLGLALAFGAGLIVGFWGGCKFANWASGEGVKGGLHW